MKSEPTPERSHKLNGSTFRHRPTSSIPLPIIPLHHTYISNCEGPAFIFLHSNQNCSLIDRKYPNMNNEQISIEKSTSANNGKHANELKFVDVDIYNQFIHTFAFLRLWNLYASRTSRAPRRMRQETMVTENIARAVST